MGGGVGAMVVAEFAVITFFLDLLVVGRSDFGDIAFVSIDFVEEGVERLAEIKTAAASIADTKDSIGLLFKL